jgi:hypothetical protein
VVLADAEVVQADPVGKDAFLDQMADGLAVCDSGLPSASFVTSPNVSSPSAMSPPPFWSIDGLGMS